MREQLANSCKRGEQEWSVFEWEDDKGIRYEVDDLYWVAGESTPEVDAYGARPVAEVYSKDDASLICAAPDMRDFLMELLNERHIDVPRLQAILHKISGGQEANVD